MMAEKTDLQRLGIVEAPREHLSFSQLDTYLNCGEQYRLRYVARAPRESQGAFYGGAAVHKAIEFAEVENLWQDEGNFFADTDPVIAYFLTILEESISHAGPVRWGGRLDSKTNTREDLAWWMTNGRFMLRRYRASRVAMAELGWQPFEGDGTELSVLAELPGVATPVLGYLDKFLMQENGEPLIVDWKTGQIGRANPFQFATYARLVEIALGIEVRQGVGVFLRAADAARRVKHVTFDGLVERMDEMYGVLVDGIERGVYAPKPSNFCVACDVRAECWFWQGQGGDR